MQLHYINTNSIELTRLDGTGQDGTGQDRTGQAMEELDGGIGQSRMRQNGQGRRRLALHAIDPPGRGNITRLDSRLM